MKALHDPTNTYKCAETSCECSARTSGPIIRHHDQIHVQNYKCPEFSNDSPEIDEEIDVSFHMAENELDQGKFAKNKVSLMIIDLG